MTKPKEGEAETEPKKVRFTASVSLVAYDAAVEIQRLYRAKTGRALPLWRILDATIISYATHNSIKIGDLTKA